MQSFALFCSVVLAVLVASDALKFKRHAARLMKRQNEEKKCCMQGSFTLSAYTEGRHLFRNSDGLAEVPFNKTQLIVKSGTTLYKSYYLFNDTPSTSLLKFTDTNGYQYVFNPDPKGYDDCWTVDKFELEDDKDAANGIFCVDYGKYAGKSTYNGEQVDIWQTDASQGFMDSQKMLYATQNERGDCIPVFEKKKLLVDGGYSQDSEWETNYEMRASLRNETKLLTEPTNMCD